MQLTYTVRMSDLFWIVAAFTVAPFFWIRITGMTGLVGMSVDLEVD